MNSAEGIRPDPIEGRRGRTRPRGDGITQPPAVRYGVDSPGPLISEAVRAGEPRSGPRPS
jgi:hypothetical protein